jgi:hypothetical protein
MSAERGLDTLIAEKVLGWRYVSPDEDYPGGWLIGSGQKIRRLPFFSADMGDAWIVVNHLEACAWLLNLNCRLLRDAQRIYTAHFREGYSPYTGRAVEDSSRESAALAICLASLKVVGVEAPSCVESVTLGEAIREE